jgi:hypothetical protein
MMVEGRPLPPVFSPEVVPSSDPEEQRQLVAPSEFDGIEVPQFTGKRRADLKNREEFSVKQNLKRPMDQAENPSVTKMRK